jgi:hypothetical protein
MDCLTNPSNLCSPFWQWQRKEGKLLPNEDAGSISARMKRDLSLGLDDPHDERAAITCGDRNKWEVEWETSLKKEIEMTDDPLPFRVFIRTGAFTSLLKNKSAMELLIQECTSDDSVHVFDYLG